MSLEKFERHLLEGRNIFLTGAGGTGKTYLMQEILKKYPANFVVTSSTGISATGLFSNARTIHSFSGIGIFSNEDFPTAKCLDFFHGLKEWQREGIKNAERVIIEEVSMISASQLNLIDRVFRFVRRKAKQSFGGCQMIILGDFLQLQPVAKKGEEVEYAFQSRAWKDANPVTIYLTEVKRTSEKEFAELLLRIRTVDYTVNDFKLLKSLENAELKHQPVLLCASNRRVDEENKLQLEKIKKPLQVFKGKYRGPTELFKEIRSNLLCPHELELKEGCRVMITSNERKYEGDDSGLDYVNGSLGTFLYSGVGETRKQFKQYLIDEHTNQIKRFDDGRPIIIYDTIKYDYLKIKLDAGYDIELRRMSWNLGDLKWNDELGKDEWEAEYKQFPVRLASALTIHKAQGLSLDNVEIDCDGIFSDSQFYVAISRARSLKGLKIKNLKGKYIRANTEALEFYKNLQ